MSRCVEHPAAERPAHGRGVLASRVRDYAPAMLDELTASGEVVWRGHGSLAGSDGWVSLHLADQAALTLPEHAPFEHAELSQQVLDALEPGGAWFFRQLSDAVHSLDDKTLSAALWDLVWAGRISNDTLTPLRALTRGGNPAHRSRRPPPRTSRPGRPARTGPPETAGRWALLPDLDTDPWWAFAMTDGAPSDCPDCAITCAGGASCDSTTMPARKC